MLSTALPLVTDCEGRSWPRVRVLRGEMTCTGCGEVAIDGRCPRCGLREDGAAVGDAPGLVATVSYLREGEYEPA